VHAVTAGTIRIVRAHEEMPVPGPLRYGAILCDRRFTEPLPLLVYVIEHPEGVFVVDVGETRASVSGLVAAAPGPFSRWLYRARFDEEVGPGEELVEQLPSLGIDPSAVAAIVVSHLHFDHVGGLGSFPETRVVMSRVEYRRQLARPLGAVPRLWPEHLDPELVDHVTEPELGMAAAPITAAGDLLVVATPGHSYGHQSVLLRTGDATLLFGGDLVFTERQLLGDGIPGVSYDVAETRRSKQRVVEYARRHPTVFLPAHDPDAPRRLAACAAVGS
jgi:N-acyl homoserine lactone hydrolase